MSIRPRPAVFAWCASVTLGVLAPALGQTQGGPERFPNNGTEPGYSRDGSKVAFGVSEGEQRSLWTMDADGTHARKVVPAAANQHYPRWSPDGSLLVFVADIDKAREYYSIKPDGTDRTLFLPDAAPKPDLVPIEWSPDAKWVAFTSKPSPDKRSRVVIVERGSGEVIQWIGGERSYGPRFSPEGTHLLFTESQKIWVGDSKGQNARPVVEGRPDSFPADPAWASDGSRIFYSMVNQQIGELWSCKPDGSDVRQVYTTPLRFFYPTPSPKGDAILLAVRQTESWDLWLFSIDLGGQNLTRLVGEDSGAPIFSMLGTYTMTGTSWPKAGEEPQATKGTSVWTRALAGEVVRERWTFDTGRRPFAGELSITRSAPNTYEAIQLNEWTGEQASFIGVWDAAAAKLTFDRVLPPASKREAVRWIYRFESDGSFSKETWSAEPGGELRKQTDARYAKSPGR